MKKNKIIFFQFLILLITVNQIYSSPIFTPAYNFISPGELKFNLKEIYSDEKDTKNKKVIKNSNTNFELNFGLLKNLELDFSIPYTVLKKAFLLNYSEERRGWNDSRIYLKYHIFSNQNYILSDRDLDVALQLGGKLKTGEKVKGLIDRENELLISLLGQYEAGIWNGHDYYIYFNFGTWLPVIEDYTYENIFQYDCAFEYVATQKIILLLETNGNKIKNNDIVYVAPGLRFKPNSSLEFIFSIAGNTNKIDGYLNTKTIAGITYTF